MGYNTGSLERGEQDERGNDTIIVHMRDDAAAGAIVNLTRFGVVPICLEVCRTDVDLTLGGPACGTRVW
jgi:hypothetical protein